MARGSACECAAVLDVLDASSAAVKLGEPREQLSRIVRMLTRLMIAMANRR